MHSICFLFICVLGSNAISGSIVPRLINLGHHWTTKTPLTFFAPTHGIRQLNYTGSSLETIPNPKTPEYLTGGIVGKEKYYIYKGGFFFEHVANGTTLSIRYLFYNQKCGSFQNAAKQPDECILVIFVPVETNGDKCNPSFNVFQGIFKTHIKKPGDCATINSYFSYSWFDNFCHSTVYTSFRGSFYYDEMGETLSNVLIIQLPELEGQNFISKKQYGGTFGSAKDCRGQPTAILSPTIDRDPSSVVKSESILIIKTLA